MDNKYGRIFTFSDVEKILEWVEGNTNSASAIDAEEIISSMDEEGVRFKWPVDEPLFILRGRDKRARGTVRYYADHQSAQAPFNHMNAVEQAYRSFDKYADEHAEQMKEPD
jgi:hypothetical protein